MSTSIGLETSKGEPTLAGRRCSRFLPKIFAGRRFGKGFLDHRLGTVEAVSRKVLEYIGRITGSSAEIARDEITIVIEYG